MTWRTIIIALLLLLSVVGISNTFITGTVTNNMPVLLPTGAPPGPVPLPVYCSDYNSNQSACEAAGCIWNGTCNSVPTPDYTCSDAACVTSSATNSDVLIALDTDIVGGVTIGAANVTLDCNNFSITNATSPESYGVIVSGYDGARIKNCSISGFDYGIVLDSSSNSVLSNNNVLDSAVWDFYSTLGSSNTVLNLTTNDTTSSFTFGGDISLKDADETNSPTPMGYTTLSHYLNITNETDAWVSINISYNDIMTYQEYADSTSCSDAYCDGDWNSGYSPLSVTVSSSYNKPTKTVGALWQVKDFENYTETTRNLTISKACLDQEPIQLRTVVDGTGVTTTYYCYDGSGYVTLGDYSTASIYEEAIWWHISDIPNSILDASAIRIWKNSSGQWWDPIFVGDVSQAGINQLVKYVYANITDFGSIYAPLGQVSIDVDDCADLTTAGAVYKLNQSVTSPGNCFTMFLGADNITLDCQGYSITGDGTGDGVHFQDVSGTVVKNCIIENYITGIYAGNAPSSQIINNTLTGNGEGIFADGENNSIKDNTISGSTIRGIRIHGEYNNITGNTVENGTSYGIYVDIGGCSCGDIISGNIIKNNSGVGLTLRTYDFIASNNEVSYGGSHGISILSGFYGLVENNSVIGNAASGIVCSGGSSLKNNNFTGNEYGIYLSSGILNNFTNNIATDNTLWDYYSWGDSENNTIINMTTDNTLYDFYGKDIAIVRAMSPGILPEGYIDIGKFLNITKTNTDSWIYIGIHYTDAELAARNINESTLGLWKYNGTVWVMLDSELDEQIRNPSRRIVDFSIITLLGQQNIQTGGYGPPSVSGTTPYSTSGSSQTYNIPTLLPGVPYVPGQTFYGSVTMDSVVSDSEAIGGGRISITETKDGLQELGTTYSYYDVRCFNFVDDTSITVTLKTRLAKSWLNQNNVTIEQIKLQKYSGTGWTDAVATAAGEDSSYYYFKAEVGCNQKLAVVAVAPEIVPEQPSVTPAEGAKAVCGNNICESALGENNIVCPADCRQVKPPFLMLFVLVSATFLCLSGLAYREYLMYWVKKHVKRKKR